MSKQYCVYVHTNRINKKKYVGQTCQSPPSYRWNSNGNGYDNIHYFFADIQKYGWDSFDHEILHTGLTKEEADAYEQYYISKYNTTDERYGYNSQYGGENHSTSQRTRKLQSLSAANRPNVTDETKEKLSLISSGLKRSQETKEKLRAAAHKREEDKRANGRSKTRRVKCLNTNTIFESCRDAADWCSLVGTSGIASVCNNGRQKTAGVHPVTKEKLKWSYVCEE